MIRTLKYLYVYILKCNDGTYYTGITNNMQRRLLEHEAGVDPESYTFSRLPVELVYAQQHINYKSAIQWEKRIKKWSQKKKEALINSDWKALIKASECNNITSHKIYNNQLHSLTPTHLSTTLEMTAHQTNIK